jgi:translation initiation factor IF-3
VPEVRLVGPNGEQVGIVRVEDALRLAAEADLDLVEVAPMAKPPVAKLMDFGKYKYEAAMKAREARKNQVNTVIKEIKLRPKIDPHDYGTKKGHVERFLKGGDKVKVTIMFRGREQSRPELGYRLLQRLAQDVLELGTVESAPKQDGRNMIMVLAPTKKKAQAMAEQRRRRDEASEHESGHGSARGHHSGDAGEAGVEPPATDEVPVSEVAVSEPPASPAPAAPAPAAPAPAPPAPAAPAAPPAPAPAAPAAPAPAAPPATRTPRPPASAPAPAAPTPAAPTPAAPTPAAPTPAPPAPAAPATPRPGAARPTPTAPTPRPTPRPGGRRA